MTYARRLTLAHMWFGFGAFAVAAVLGVWQMWARSPLPAPFLTAEAYFTSVTAHGVSIAETLDWNSLPLSATGGLPSTGKERNLLLGRAFTETHPFGSGHH